MGIPGMRPWVVLAVLSLLVAACAPAAPVATPTQSPAAPTKPAVAAPTPAPKAEPAATPKPAAPTPAPTSTPAPKVKRGGTLRYAHVLTHPTLDPHLTSTGLGGPPALDLLFDGLLDYQRDEKTGLWDVKPELAESWQMPDKTTIVMKLRKGVKFHDGSDFNAEVAKWNIDRWATHPKFWVKAYSGVIKGAEAVDPYTVKMTLKNPSASTLIVMTRATDPCFSIMSKESFDKLGEGKMETTPVGTGAMQLGQWLRDDRLILKKFPNYWRKGADDQPLPYLNEYVERFIPDPSVTLLELRAGSIDMTEEVEAKDIASIKTNPELVYLELSWGGVHQFTAGFNFKSDKPAIKSLKVRQAAWHALDRESMAKALGFGVAKPHYYPNWGPGMLGYDDKNPKYEYNEAKAKQLLTEAGYAGGVDIALSLITRQPDLRISEMAKAMWDKVGIRTTLDTMERLAWLAHVAAAKGEAIMWRAAPFPDSDLVNRYLVTGMASNYPQYSNAELDKCMGEGASEYDPAKRNEIYKRCQKILYDDAYFGVGYSVPANKVFQKYVKGVKMLWQRSSLREVWLDK